MLRNTLYVIERALSFGGRLSERLERFARYGFVGISTFVFQLLLIWWMENVLEMHYTYAVGIAFVVAVSFNYLWSRQWVFRGSRRTLAGGYFYFLCILAAGLVLAVTLTAFVVETTGAPVLIARTLVGVMLGVTSYLVNLYFTFRMAGEKLIRTERRDG